MSVISDGLIGIDGSAFFDVVQNFSLQSFALHIRHDCRANLPEIPVEHSHVRLSYRDGHLPADSAVCDLCAYSRIRPPTKVSSTSTSPAISAKFLYSNSAVLGEHGGCRCSMNHADFLGDSESSTELHG